MRNTREEREGLARRKEQWILRVEQGEDPDKVRRELKLRPCSLAWLRQRYKAGGRKWQALLERRHGIARKGTAEVKAFLKKAKGRNLQATGAELCVEVWERFGIDISLSRLNELLHAERLSNSPGRPRKEPAPETPSAPERDIDNAGVFFPCGGVERTGRARGRARRG
jgi:transposase